ncbi:unnamed protein product [Amaranthus hypochondriacus]
MNRLPPGFRFQPTDEELLFEYLRCKIFSLPLPASIIPEVSFSNYDPWDLPGDSMEEKYVFTKKETKYKNKSQYKRATRSGYWDIINGSEKHMFPPPNTNLGRMIMKGIKKTWVFHFGRSPNNQHPTHWFMHEYSLALDVNHNYDSNYKIEDWVVCHIFFNQRMEEEDEAIVLDDGHENYNLRTTSCMFNDMVLFNHSSTCSSSSSSSSNSIIEDSSNDLQSDEESNYF